jgi:hypothetical protein
MTMHINTSDIKYFEEHCPNFLQNGRLPASLYSSVEIMNTFDEVPYDITASMIIKGSIEKHSIDPLENFDLYNIAYGLFENDRRRKILEGEFLLSWEECPASVFTIIETEHGSVTQTSFGFATVSGGLFYTLIHDSLVSSAMKNQFAEAKRLKRTDLS